MIMSPAIPAGALVAELLSPEAVPSLSPRENSVEQTPVLVKKHRKTSQNLRKHSL